ncbi:polysaccharide biosynthesis tyrosine autokinase [Erythrobacter insulae]|uniref:non-specific protein-tyrosine kinase n=1 Tax=Erythrobacter insulae TaxID=2584124 RepID=A0A547PC03_9SPHN|nr:polysaccharide biosynthesis tyrosine autokinase [Erythrobacter insulae]TRD11669.1 polysaccharide biosynthesis tyrosine autokinase [Erythrobacter insulae]
MNDPQIFQAPEPRGSRSWIDSYLPQNQMVHHQPRQKLIDMAAVRGVIFRQRWLIAGIIIAAVVTGLIVTLLATPMYEARSTVRVEPYASYIVEGQNVDQGIAPSQVFQQLNTYVGIITSRNLANVVAEQKNLGERTDFLGPNIDESRPENMSDAQWLDAKQKMAAAKLHRSVSSEFPTNNWIITIVYRSEDPQIAAEMANAYSDAFVASDTKDTIAENEYAKEYLREQIQLVRGRLEEAEQAANGYARRSGIIVQTGQDEFGASGQTLTSSNLASINTRVAAATADRIAAEQRWRSVQSVPASQLPEVQSNQALQTLISDRTLKETELTDLRQRYNDEFPQIGNVRAQIETLNRQINRSSSDIKASVRNEYIVARNRENALRQELSDLTGATLAEQDRQVEYSVLEREAGALRLQLQALLARFNQVSTATDIQSGTINPLDTAIAPGSPYSPNLLRNMLMSIVFGIAFAGALAVLRELLDDRVRSLDDVEERLGLPLLGHTPFVEDEDIGTEGRNRFGSLMESYASIRSTIDFALPRDRNVIQLTSSEASEGKSTTAIILAELFASLGRKTLLIDADMRRPSLAGLIDVKDPEYGFVEVLLGHTDLESAVIKGVHENLEILPIRELPTNPSEILSSKQLRDFIDKYREEYSLIIFDAPPVLGLADAPALAGMVDGSIFVLEANRVRFSQAKVAIRRLQSAGGNVFGTVLTKYRALEAGQSYNYNYDYYQYGKSK